MRIGQATNQTELLAALNAALETRTQKKRGFETVWWNSLALVAGDHYARWDPLMSTFVDTDVNLDPEDRQMKTRMVLNHAQTVARTELSKLTKTRPILDIMANSDEQDDLAATKVGLKVLEGLEWKLKMRKRRKDALWWMIILGMGGTFVGFDYLNESAGMQTFDIDPATGEGIFDPERLAQLREAAKAGEGPEPTQEKYPMGEIEYRVYSPFQLFPDDKVLDWDELKEIIVQDVWDVDCLKGVYGAKADKVQPEQVALGVMEQRMLARAGVAPSASSQDASDAAKVNTWWCEPGYYRGNKYLEKGKMIRWTQGSIVLEESKTFPYLDGQLPFAWYTHIPSALSIWPRSVMEDIREANLEIDKTVSQLIANKDYMANPMWLVATQHRLKNKIRNVAGSITRYTHVPGIPEPQPVQGLEMPAQVENLVVALRDQILDISGQSEVSRGKMPSGVRSGVQVAYLQEEDDTKIAPTVENMELAMAREGQLILERVSQFYRNDRILGYYRRDGMFDVVKFKGVDLKSQTHVVTQLGSAMPKSKAARQQYTIELVGLGIEQDKKRINQMLELGNGEPDEQDLSIAQANRENNTMLHGLDMHMFTLDPKDPNSVSQVVQAAVPVKQWHNHQVHVERHRYIMMDETFDELAIKHPEIVALFDQHVAMHEQILQQQQEQQMQMLMAAKGAPDGPPTAAGGASPTPPSSSNGQPQGPQMMSQTGVPDPYGGGAVQTSARSFQSGPS